MSPDERVRVRDCLPVLVSAYFYGLFSLLRVAVSLWRSVFGCVWLGRGGWEGVAAPVPRSMNRGTGCPFRLCLFVCPSGVPGCLPGDAQMRTRQEPLPKKRDHLSPSSKGMGSYFWTELSWGWGLPGILPGAGGTRASPSAPPGPPS